MARPTQFPVQWILKDSSRVAKFVWLLIPLQYYVLTTFPGGFKTDAYVPSAVMTLFCFIAIFGSSCCLGIFPLKGTREYAERVRLWAISLIVTWAVSLGLLAVLYFVGLRNKLNTDVIGACLCKYLDCQDGYPSFQLSTLLSYFIYSIIASLMIVGAAWTSRYFRHSTNWGPNILPWVVIVNTLIMFCLYGASTWPHRSSSHLYTPPLDSLE
jgi:hypothetical protein